MVQVFIVLIHDIEDVGIRETKHPLATCAWGPSEDDLYLFTESQVKVNLFFVFFPQVKLPARSHNSQQRHKQNHF